MKPSSLAFRYFVLAQTVGFATARSSHSSKELDAVHPIQSRHHRIETVHQPAKGKESEPLRNDYDSSFHTGHNDKQEYELEFCEPDQGILACSKRGESCQQEEDTGEWHCFPSGDAFGYEDTGVSDFGVSKESDVGYKDTELTYDLFTTEEGTRDSKGLDDSIDVPDATFERHLYAARNCPDPLPKVSPDIEFYYLVSSCTFADFGECPEGFEDLSCWDTSEVTNMDYAFRGVEYFNFDISSWDVSSVNSMQFMFMYSYFDGNVSAWDVGAVTNMQAMFYYDYFFQGDISEWDVSAVRDMGGMFASTTFNGDISNWDVGAVTQMDALFLASEFDNDISKWNVSSVTGFDQIFEASTFSGDISKWDVGSVKTMYQMFLDASVFNGDLSNWDVGSVTDMGYMFVGCENFNQNLGAWAFKVPSVVDTTDMFRNSGCEIQSDPRPGELPWCQEGDVIPTIAPSALPSAAPSGAPSLAPSATPSAAPYLVPSASPSFSPVDPFDDCADALVKFKNLKRKMKTCKKIAKLFSKESTTKKKKKKICRKKAKVGNNKKMRVRDYCRETCGRAGFGPPNLECIFPE